MNTINERFLVNEFKKIGFGKPFKTWYNTIDNSFYPKNIIGLVQFLGEKYHIIISAADENDRLNQVSNSLKTIKNNMK